MTKTYKCAWIHSETGKHYEEDIAADCLADAIEVFKYVLINQHRISISRLSELDISEVV